VEFLTQAQIFRKYGTNGVTEYCEFGDEGSITDDTQMTLFTVEGILRGVVRDHEKGISDPESVMYNAYLRWRKTQGSCVMEIEDSGWMIKEKALWQVRAPGNTCLSSLEKPFTGGKVNNSKGCGSVMRMAPVGLCMAPEEAYKWGCKFAAITHGHDTGITAAGALAMLISYLVKKGRGLEESVRKVLAHLASDPRAGETLSALQKVFTAKDISELGEGWIAEEALAISVYAVLSHPYDLRRAVQMAVNISGDSDSTGAITGNIAGALNGEDAIPASWKNNLREYMIVSQVADDLHEWYESDEYGHCTAEWWDKYPGY
jgi:ADP-ribosylglycohydrolase